MTATEKPMSRKERRAAEHAERKAQYKAQRAAERAAAVQTPNQSNEPADVMTEAEKIETLRSAVGQTINASTNQPTSEPLNVPSVEEYIGGPRTEAGKQISSQNALKHGSCSTSILINPNESLAGFLALEKRWLQSYKPESTDETELIKAAVRAEWFYLRAERNFAEYESQLGSPATWEENQHKTYARFLRYRTANQNILNKSRKAVEDYRKNRQQEAAKAQAMDIAKQKLEIAKTRLTIYQENNEPDVPFDQLLENMRQKATRLGFRKPDSNK